VKSITFIRIISLQQLEAGKILDEKDVGHKEFDKCSRLQFLDMRSIFKEISLGSKNSQKRRLLLLELPNSILDLVNVTVKPLSIDIET